MNPNRPEHANKDFPTSHPRLTGRRWLEGYHYAANGNVHNPTPKYRWLLLVDGKPADNFRRLSDLRQAVAVHGDEYIS